MNKENLIIAGVLIGSFVIANQLLKATMSKIAEPMSNADGGRRERRDKKTGGEYRDWETDRKSTRLNSSHSRASRMPSSA